MYYKDEPKETIFERSIEKRIKLEKEKSDEIERTENNINNELFKVYFTGYQSPSNMYKNLSQTKRAVNKVWMDSIKKLLSKLQRIIDYGTKDEAAKIKGNEEIIDIVECILYFNQLNQAGQGLKILKPNKMPSGLTISLAELNAGNNSEKRKHEIRHVLSSLHCSKKLTKRIYNNFINTI